jgi:hypothetical protein
MLIWLMTPQHIGGGGTVESLPLIRIKRVDQSKRSIITNHFFGNAEARHLHIFLWIGKFSKFAFGTD